MVHFVNCKGTLALAWLQAASLGSARSLWSSQPATYAPQSSDETILKTTYPIGNGKLGGELETPSLQVTMLMSLSLQQCPLGHLVQKSSRSILTPYGAAVHLRARLVDESNIVICK